MVNVTDIHFRNSLLDVFSNYLALLALTLNT